MISSRWVTERTCALTRKQSSPVMRWHSTTSGMLRTSSVTLWIWRGAGRTRMIALSG